MHAGWDILHYWNDFQNKVTTEHEDTKENVVPYCFIISNVFYNVWM